ncbi:hypothetical protein LOK49_LG06G02092 [Camellia lanceoleosa]|uniref:Uncharacterized protein n=1 Tax=Camellia lanceoleosa TaxID=1840588 RepID=A0ACC0HF34_9ERIC|nr:hypothetical protein LOK49_LG06G02092 [Camellia lanceoleosa]
MATITMLSQFQCSTFTIRSLCKHVQTNHNATSINLCTVQHNICGRQLNLCSSSREGLRCLSKPIAAVGSGLEVSTDPKDNAITIKNVKILVESQEDDKIQVPKSFLLQVLGEERVTKFVIQEIVSSTMADYVKKENLNVKDKKINTVETAEELKSLFAPGNEFGFNATLEIKNLESETTSS